MLIRVLLSAFLLLILSVFGLYQYSNSSIGKALPIEKTQLYIIKPGVSYSKLLKDFQKRGWIGTRLPFRIFAKLNPNRILLKTGTYQLNKGLSFEQVVNIFHTGKEHQFKVTFVEGSTFKEWLLQLEQLSHIKRTLDINPKSRAQYSQVMTLLGSNYDYPEGLFFPDTYLYTAGSTDISILKTAYLRMDKELRDSWANKTQQLPYKNAYEALIMASIIEKETGKIAEQPLISSVFINRLAKRMRLQTDPTIIYGLGEKYTGDITYANIRGKTKYNTYRINGLPPTPIAMPGKSAINASLNPSQSEYYYFVSKGNGEHYFSKSLKEHNKAVKRFIKGSK